MPASTMSLTKAKVTIEGLPPGLIFQGKGLMEAEALATKKGKPAAAREEAEARAHWMGSGKNRQLCIPAVMLYRCFCQAASNFKDPRKKARAITSLIASTVAFEEDKIGLGTSDFDVLEEWVRIPPRTGSCVKIGRALLKEWSCTFTLLVDDEVWKAELLEDIIAWAGKNVGIGAWRPSLKGPYGKFVLKEFVVCREDKK